jgi:hypothetical protein
VIMKRDGAELLKCRVYILVNIVGGRVDGYVCPSCPVGASGSQDPRRGRECGLQAAGKVVLVWRDPVR